MTEPPKLMRDGGPNRYGRNENASYVPVKKNE